jgi:hypothetical protein
MPGEDHMLDPDWTDRARKIVLGTAASSSSSSSSSSIKKQNVQQHSNMNIMRQIAPSCHQLSDGRIDA